MKIPSPLGNGEMISFAVHEPATLEGGKTYPIILHSHGFGGSKETGSGNGGGSGLTYSMGAFTSKGYGAISIDERGHGESGGDIRVMDPDFEGKNLVAVVDWAEANLAWAAYGPDDDAPNPFAQRNLLLGAIGGSYGGGYQYNLLIRDPKRRLDAIVPDYTWSDLTFSLQPGGVIKTGWVGVLFGAGNTAGSQGMTAGNFDPFVTGVLQNGLQNNKISQEGLDFFRYHGLGYFCDGVPVATNGGAGTAPELPPLKPGKIHALVTQGYRDTLFNFNDNYKAFECLKAAGGDVRFTSYQAGHNTLQAIPDPGQAFQPPGSTTSFACGNLNKDAATLAFFEQHLKGQANALATAKVLPGLCLSLAGTDAIQVADITRGTAGTMKAVPATNVVSGGGINVPVAVSLYTAPLTTDVLAGIPYAELEVKDATGLQPNADTIIFVGIGHRRAPASGAGAGVWDLVDNQLLPLRGLKTHKVDLVGVAERLRAGDEVGLLFYGAHDQFHLATARPPNNIPVTVTGKVWLPLLGNVAPNP
jgi:ABC-2 type transport system ATP-binding protein